MYLFPPPFFRVFFFFILVLLPVALSAQVNPVNDQAFAAINKPVEIKVLANDGLHTCNAASITLAAISSPTHGTVELIEGNKFKYTPTAGYAGKDYFDYRITCSGSTDIATVNILVGRLPGNFFELDCQYIPDDFDFGLELKSESHTYVNGQKVVVNVDNYNAMVAGDIDGDGYTEIIAMKPNTEGAGHNGGSYFTSGFHIFNHKAELIRTVDFPADGSGSRNIYSTYINSITIADLNNDGKGEIVFSTMGSSASSKFQLLVYDYQGNLKATGPASAAAYHNTVGVADFDNDGYPEIYAGTSIYRYTGSALIELYRGTTNIYSMAQDIDNDGFPEIITPTQSYKVSIKTTTGPGSGGNANSVSVFKTSEYNTQIGSNLRVFALADVDLDGQIEVVVVVPSGTHLILYIWNPATGIAKYTEGVAVSGGGLNSCFPFIGDSDGDGYPDIAFMGGSGSYTAIYRFGYNEATNSIVQKGVDGVGFQDYSSRVTGLSMFDFNLDNKMEVVYRDELNLYILDGTDFSIIHKEVNNKSGTLREYPLIVSLTPSGESYVLINSSSTATNQVGTLRIYGSNSTPWAPSRRVWNQFAFYQNVVNDDLKVLSNPLPLNFKMENDTKTIYPFNGHQVQLGPIDAKTLQFVRPAPDLGLSGITYNYNTETDILTVSVTMMNTGDASMDNPIPVETYKVAGGVKTLIQTNNCTDDLHVGTPLVYTYTIASYSTHLPMDKLEVVVAKSKIDCKPDNNNGDFAVKLKAVADLAETDVNVAKTINVISNDNLGDCTAANIAVSVEGTPTKGTATVSGKNVVYTPANNNIGSGKFYYTITCDGNSSTGRVDVATASLARVAWEVDASEPTNPGRIKFFFREPGAIADNDVKVYYTISAPGLTLGQDYTVSPASYVTIPKGQAHAFLTVTPINNYVVEGNDRKVNVTIDSVEVVPNP